MTAQAQLEECCYEFAAKWLPLLLKENKWNCAEAVELTKWTRTLRKRCDKLPVSAILNDSKTPLDEVFFSTNILRHTAVHRLSTSARQVHKMIGSALRLARTLGDGSRAAELENLYLEIGSRVRDMELNENFLENRLDERLQAIHNQRAELDRQEKEAIATMLREDQENQFLIGSFMEDAVKNAFGNPEVKHAGSTSLLNGGYESDESLNDKEETGADPEIGNGDKGTDMIRNL